MEYNRPQTNPDEMKKRARRDTPNIKFILLASAIVLFAICVLFVYPPYTMVPTGHTGVVVTFGHVEDYTLNEGFHFKNPFQQIVMMDNRTQKKTIASQAFSSDIQQVDLVCSVNYSVDRETAQTLYKSVGVNYYSTVMEPRILENVKAVFTRYSAEKLMQVRDTLSAQIVQLLQPEMKKYGIQIVAVAIENVDFTDAFTNAVEDKQVAEQTKLRVETEQAQQVSVEKATAERQIIAANADAEKRTIIASADASVKKIEADAAAYARKIEAETEATANKLIAASITTELVDYLKINQWNGQLPQITTGDGVMPIIDLTEKKAD